MVRVCVRVSAHVCEVSGAVSLRQGLILLSVPEKAARDREEEYIRADE